MLIEKTLAVIQFLVGGFLLIYLLSGCATQYHLTGPNSQDDKKMEADYAECSKKLVYDADWMRMKVDEKYRTECLKNLGYGYAKD